MLFFIYNCSFFYVFFGLIVGEKLVTSVHSTGRAVAMSNGMHNGGGFDPGVRFSFYVVTVLLTVYFVVSCSWSLDGAAYGNNFLIMLF